MSFVPDCFLVAVNVSERMSLSASLACSPVPSWQSSGSLMHFNIQRRVELLGCKSTRSVMDIEISALWPSIPLCFTST